MTTPTPPTLTFVVGIVVEVGVPIDCGPLPDGHRRVIPLLGGRFAGPELLGRVLPAGVDDQILRSDTVTELDATYVLETDDGERIHVHNRGIRQASAEDTAALVRGEPVPPERVYFRTRPTLTTSASRIAWINDRLFVATARRRPTTVELDVFVIG